MNRQCSQGLRRYFECTLAASSTRGATAAAAAARAELHGEFRAALSWGVEQKLLHHDDPAWSATPAGRAIYLSGLSPAEGVRLRDELKRTLKCFRTSTDLQVQLALTPTMRIREAAGVNWPRQPG